MRVLSRSRRLAALVSAAGAAERALCLAVMILRTEFEMVASLDITLTPAQREAIADRLTGPRAYYLPWLRSEGLWERLSKSEANQLMLELGGWSRQTCAAHFGDADAAGVLIWTLGLLDELPAYDMATDEGTVLAALPVLRPARVFIERARSRPEPEILQAREQAQTWLWRARMTMLQREGMTGVPGGSSRDLRPAIAAHARELEAQGAFTAIDRDFPAFGKRYSALSDGEWSLMHQIAYSRLRALNWLCGFASDWDAVPLET